MHKQHKNIGIIVLSIILIVVAIGSGIWANYSQKDNKECELTVILPDSDNTRWKTFKTGMRAAAKEYDISLKTIKIEQIKADNQLEEAITEALSSGTDGIITEFSNVQQADNILNTSLKNVPVILTQQIYEDDENTRDTLGILEVDASTIANTLALQLSRNHKSENLSIGIVLEDGNDAYTQSIQIALNVKLSELGFTTLWTLSNEDLSVSNIKSQKDVGAILALDSTSLEIASDYKNETNNDVQLFGIGTSDKCIYNTDIEVINSILIPDDYYSGYTAVANLYSNIINNTSLSTYSVKYRIISKANLYTSTNQKLLFPIGN